jgi:hypothetical protein
MVKARSFLWAPCALSGAIVGPVDGPFKNPVHPASVLGKKGTRTESTKYENQSLQTNYERCTKTIMKKREANAFNHDIDSPALRMDPEFQ